MRRCRHATVHYFIRGQYISFPLTQGLGCVWYGVVKACNCQRFQLVRYCEALKAYNCRLFHPGTIVGPGPGLGVAFVCYGTYARIPKVPPRLPKGTTFTIVQVHLYDRSNPDSQRTQDFSRYIIICSCILILLYIYIFVRSHFGSCLAANFSC